MSGRVDLVLVGTFDLVTFKSCPKLFFQMDASERTSCSLSDNDWNTMIHTCAEEPLRSDDGVCWVFPSNVTESPYEPEN